MCFLCIRCKIIGVFISDDINVTLKHYVTFNNIVPVSKIKHIHMTDHIVF